MHIRGVGFGLVLALSALLMAPAFAQSAGGATVPQPEFDSRKIFFMLFLMLGPIKILVPFVNLTRGSDVEFRRRLASRSILFSAAALALAVVLGRTMLENFDISLPVLAMTGGIVLFLVALQTVLQQSTGSIDRSTQDDQPIELRHALTPLAFPVIVTPYGIAAVIVFATLAAGQYQAELTVGGIVLMILALDWIAMLFAGAILKWVGTALQIFAVVLGVTQIALGLQVILHSLSMMGIFQIAS
ncbi:MarC family protein [Mesorhizobium sp. 1B3]|uniref:MarC family protein n=1 Tax=Mesorhizobium sp. 1B3 TaxID=3243599 RepID=UPI003D979D0A